MNDSERIRISLADARDRLRDAAPKAFIELFKYGDCSVELYAPKGTDPQQPHPQDELYIIASGSGTFRRNAHVVSFVPGDVLFVPARLPHRFETFTEDFATWVVFFGPTGGSKPQS